MESLERLRLEFTNYVLVLDYCHTMASSTLSLGLVGLSAFEACTNTKAKYDWSNGFSYKM